MIYPLLPIFLSSVLGAGAVALGAIEGMAEMVASVLKIAAGVWADRVPRRKPLVAAGYSVSNLMRPLIGLAIAWPAVLVLRVVDRIGKGIRTSPRDALIADVTDEKARGIAFGVQRSMDHAGAVVGPLVSMGLLWLLTSRSWHQDNALRFVFLLSAIPAVMVIIILLAFVKESAVQREYGKALNLLHHWRSLGTGFHKILFAIFVFTLGNSTDAFLLLRLSNVGVSTEWIAGLWSLHHVVKMIASAISGYFSDYIGRRPMLVSGWLYYAVIYGAFAVFSSQAALITIFILYGVYYGLTEPSERAWVADLAPEHLRGQAFGWYNGAVGLAALPASIIFGEIWAHFSSKAAFLTGAGLALLAGLLLFGVPLKRENNAAGT
jgi:MFS family permease